MAVLLTPAHKLCLPTFGLPLSRGIGKLTKEGFGGRLLPSREFIEHIEDFVVPARLFFRLGIDIEQPRPNFQIAIANHQKRHAAGTESKICGNRIR